MLLVCFGIQVQVYFKCRCTSNTGVLQVQVYAKKHLLICGKPGKEQKRCTVSGCPRMFFRDALLIVHIERDHASNNACSSGDSNEPAIVQSKMSPNLSTGDFKPAADSIPTNLLLDNHSVSDTGTLSFSCGQCHAAFRYKYNLKRHSRRCGKTDRRHRKCYVPGCLRTFYHETHLVMHLEKHHAVPVCDSQMSFKSMGDFLQWKGKEEDTKFSFFIKAKRWHQN